MYKLAVFDLDGTVLDTLDDLESALNHTLRKFSFPEKTREQVRSLVGHGLRNLVKDASGSEDDVLISRLHSEIASYYLAHSAEQTRPYAGIPEMLQHLKERGIKIAVCSNKKDEVTSDLCSRFFPGVFDVCRGERPDTPIKPSPESVHAIMNELGASSGETVYIGDSEVDVLTASNAGIDSIIVTWGFRSREALESAGASVLADDVQTLEGIITSSQQ